MPQVGQDRPAGRLGGYAPTGNPHQRLSGHSLRIWPPSLGTSCARRPLRAISREAGVGAMKAAVVLRRGTAGIAQKRVRIRPTDVRLVGGLSARKRASDSLKPSGAHLVDQGSICAHRRTGRYRTGQVGESNRQQRVVGRRAYNRQRRERYALLGRAWAEKHRLASSLGAQGRQRRARW
jgi:hypothetical protein